MNTNFLHVGFGNFVAMNRVLGVGAPKSNPARRALVEAEDNGLLITMTKGRRVGAAIFIDTGHIVLTSLEPETIASRVAAEEGFEKK